MMMKRTFALMFAMFSVAGCSLWESVHPGNDYEKAPFYAKYLDPANANDQRMMALLQGLKANPKSAQMHNELGSLLVEKGFPKDAEVEFERAVNSDGNFYPAWYNLGLVRAARGDVAGAYRAFHATIHYKPGHSAALFQLGLVEERQHRNQDAIAHYAKAYAINPLLLDVQVNPRVLDSKLTHLALLRNYRSVQTTESMQFQPAPQGYHDREMPAPSKQAPADQIVPPSAPLTDPASQPAPLPAVTGT